MSKSPNPIIAKRLGMSMPQALRPALPIPSGSALIPLAISTSLIPGITEFGKFQSMESLPRWPEREAVVTRAMEVWQRMRKSGTPAG